VRPRRTHHLADVDTDLASLEQEVGVGRALAGFVVDVGADRAADLQRQLLLSQLQPLSLGAQAIANLLAHAFPP
jgi:hypothetical protein